MSTNLFFKKSLYLTLLVLITACGGSSGNKDTVPIDTTAIDTTAPAITLNGDAVIEHNYGDVYNDLGAEATDNVDISITVVTTGSVIIDTINSYTITYTATDNAGNTSSIERTVNVVDTIAPVITLNGDAVIEHNYGDVYTDLGAEATDNTGGSVTIITTGTVIVDMLNSYTIAYTATDSSGNTSSVYRMVKVLDLTGPVITLNGDSTITLGKGRVYKELGATAIDGIDGEIIVDVPKGSVDYDNLGQYELTYSVTDSDGNVATLVRSVDIVEPKPFITIWKTDNQGSSADNEITITTNDEFNVYDYNVDWGDGYTDEHLTGDFTHTYDVAGTYKVTISGVFPQLYFYDHSKDNRKLLSIEQWGDGLLLSLKKAFNTCFNLIGNAKDIPNLRLVKDMSRMFGSAIAFNQNISAWDVSSVTNMEHMFYNAQAFNQDISDWDVSSVTNMEYMFSNAVVFNQNISNWDVRSVTNMEYMFWQAEAFNLDISAWDVSSVTNMQYMFRWAYTFNQDISAWDVSSVTNMQYMFRQAWAFNQDISAWDVSSVINMSAMFSDAEAFNQNLSSWDVSSVTNMTEMFASAKVFNQDISAWDVSSVNRMRWMFLGAEAFNQNISAWDVSSVTSMGSMFRRASSFNQDISAWNVSSVGDMREMFSNAYVFNQDISAWDVSSVRDMRGMFENVTLSTDNYDAILNGWSNQQVEGYVDFSAGDSQYSPASQAARDILTNTYRWRILDGGITP